MRRDFRRRLEDCRQRWERREEPCRDIASNAQLECALGSKLGVHPGGEIVQRCVAADDDHARPHGLRSPLNRRTGLVTGALDGTEEASGSSPGQEGKISTRDEHRRAY